MDQQEDTANSKKDDENNASLLRARAYPHEESGDAADFTKDCNIHAEDFKDQPISSCDTDSLTIPISTTSIETHPKISQNVKDKILKERVPIKDIQSVGSNSKESNTKDIENTEYKETVLDISDTDLELRWTDDDDDSHMHSEPRPLSDKALKELDEELGITGEVQNINQDSIDVSKKVEKQVETVEGKPAKVIDITVDNTENSSKVSLGDDMLKKVNRELEMADHKTNTENVENRNIDQRLDIASSEKPIGTSINDSFESEIDLDQTVEQLQQLIDLDDDVKQKSKIVNERKKSAEINLTTTDNSKLDIDSLGVTKSPKESINNRNDTNNQVQEFITVVETDKQPTLQLATINIGDKNVKIEPRNADLPPEMEDNSTIIENKSSDNVNVEPMDEDLLPKKEDTGENTKGNRLSSKIEPGIEFHDCINTSIPMQKSENLNKKTKVYNADSLNVNDSIDNASIFEENKDHDKIKGINDSVEDNIEVKNEMITPDLENSDSNRIHTEHGVNRPDVMLDIPSQEFDFDEFADASDMMDDTTELGKTNKDCNNLIEKTVTEIVNQLARDDEEVSENSEFSGIPDSYLDNISKSISDKKITTHGTNSNTTIDIGNQPSHTSVETTLTSIEKNVTDVSKPHVTSKIDNKIPIGSQSTQVTLEKKLKGSELSTDIAEVYQRANVLGKSLEKDTQSCDISKENVNDQGANYIDNKYLEPTELSAELEKQEQLIEKASETGVLANEICIEKMSKKEGTNPQPDTLETDKATENVKYQQDKATVLERNQKYPGPSNEYVKEQEDENSEVKTKDQETVESLTVTDKEQKSESTKEKDSQSEGILEKDPNITEQLTQKHTDEKMDVKPSKSNADANDIQPLTSNDDAKGETLDLPSTSNAVATHSLDVQPSTINADAKLSTDLQSPTSNDDAKGKTLDLPSTSNSTAAHSIDVQPSTINADAKGETLDIPSTSNDDVKRETLDMPSTSNTTATDSIDVQPLPINADAKLTTGLQPSNAEAKNKNDGQPDGKNLDSDNSEDVPEVAQDSLGLLAESSRVIDDDDEREAEEDEAEFGEGEDDDDDDFDPDDEESSNQHSEESNPAQSEIDIKDEGIDIVFGNEADTIGTADSNDANDGFMADEITIEDNEPAILDSIKTELIEEDIDLKPKEEADKTEKPTTEVRKSILSELLAKAKGADETKPSESKKSPAMSVFEASKNIVSIVDLGSSSEDDVQVHQKAKLAPPSGTDTKPDKVSVSASKSEPDKGTAECEKTAKESKKEDKEKSKHGEIFNLDSDEDDIKSTDSKDIEDTSQPRNNQCINHHCTSDYTVPYYLADRVTVAYYGAARRRKRPVCQSCLNIVIARNQGLLTGIKDMRPLMSLRMSRPAQQLLEISDSDSEGEDDPVGVGGAKILEEHLAELLNETWIKYKMDDRLKETEDYLQTELKKMEKQSIEIDNLLKDCQKETDKLRVEFYAGFEPNRKELPALSMQDTPIASYSCLESEEEKEALPQVNLRYPKRRSSSAIETTAKKQAIVSGCMDENDQNNVTRASLATKDEDKDISVVRLTAESAPADLPPPGELTRPPLRAGAPVFAMKNPYGAWLRGRLIEVLPKTPDQQFSQCRVRFEHKTKNLVGKVVAGRCIAYTEPCGVRMTIGTRVIALFNNSDNTMKRQSFFYSGIIAEIPNPVNTYRYLVFFDDGYVQYVQHCDVRLVYESSALVWEEVHPFSRDFVCNYLLKYPERPMVRMHTGQSLVVEYNGKWLETKVIAVDAAVVKVQFSDYRTEWIYRGSTRLQPLFVEFQAARRGDRARLPRSTKVNTRTNMPYVEYTRSDEQSKNNEQQQSQALEELRRQRAVAKKSTSAAMPQVMNPTTDVVSRVVHYTPKNSVRPYKMVPHTCGPQCKRNDLLSLKDLRTYNPLTKPLLSGWERQMIRHKYAREIMYRAPCGRRLRCMSELHLYLRTVGSEMPVDLFDFNPNTHCLAEFVLNKSNVQKKDLSNGKENVPVPCVNYYDNTLPEFCSYNTERTPTAGVPLNLDPDFLCGCDCDDDCADKTKCACWKMTLEGARTIGIEGPNIGYEYRRLPEPLPSGIYECNSRCKCKSTCLNRVVQNPLQLKLQVFKTLNRGWGIRALNDVPKGSFLCIYAGNLLTDATANLDGLNEGDEYLAELDYIEVVEAMKEGYEEDIPEADKELDKKETKKPESEPESEPSESEDEDKRDRNDQSDDDFRPTPYVGMALTDFSYSSKRLRRRDKNKKNKDGDNNKEDKDQKAQEAKTDTKADDDEDCITISDDEEVRVSTREPARFTAQEGMTDSKVIPKYRSIRTYFGRDEACYIMDAKVQGNIGRYLNHSCSPNVFVQNVFVDTHDPRFPWVSFFALHYIRAGTELTWNYNYDIGSVPGKVLYCFCGAPNCRGRLL